MFLLITSMMMLSSCGNVISEDTSKTLLFDFTMVGDDGMLGLASGLELRYSDDPDSVANNFFDCQLMTWDNLHALKPGGQKDTVIVTHVYESGKNYYFAMRAVDEAGNWSLSSNVLEVYIADETPPLAINDLNVN